MAQTPPKPAAPKKEKAEPEPKIEGITIPRDDGRFLGLTVEGVHFMLRCYDAQKKPEKPDVARASVRWTPVNVRGEQRCVLNPAPDGMSFVSPDVVRPPLTFRAFFVLLSADDKVVQAFSVNLNDLPPPDSAKPAPVSSSGY